MQTQFIETSLTQDTADKVNDGYFRESEKENKCVYPEVLKKRILLFIPITSDALIIDNDDEEKEGSNQISIVGDEIKQDEALLYSGFELFQRILGSNLIVANRQGVHCWTMKIKGKLPTACIGIITKDGETYYALNTATGAYKTNDTNVDCTTESNPGLFLSLHKFKGDEHGEHTLKITLDTLQSDNYKVGFKVIGDSYIKMNRSVVAFKNIKRSNYKLYANISILSPSSYTLIKYQNKYETEMH